MLNPVAECFLMPSVSVNFDSFFFSSSCRRCVYFFIIFMVLYRLLLRFSLFPSGIFNFSLIESIPLWPLSRAGQAKGKRVLGSLPALAWKQCCLVSDSACRKREQYLWGPESVEGVVQSYCFPGTASLK